MTGIFGGSFNPVHLGHTRLAQWIVAHGYADSVWLMVSPQNPLKPAADLLSEDLRYELAQIATRDIEGVEASRFEFDLPRPSFTYRTLEALHRAYPSEEFALVIGADNWLCFDRWARSADIVARYPILVYPRQGYTVSATPPSGVTLMPAPLFPYSSTQVRQALATGADTTRMLCPAVLNRLHQSEEARVRFGF